MRLRDVGLFLRSARTDARIRRLRSTLGPAGALEAVYAADPDPWASASPRYRYQRRKYEALASLLPPRRFRRALDLGCGLGLLSRRLADDVPLTYLDSANTSQKPQVVIDAITEHYAHHNANVARAMHLLGAEATEAYEQARADIAALIGAAEREVVFTKNATEALNLAAYAFSKIGRAHV